MGAVVGLVLAAGALSCWLSAWTSPVTRTADGSRRPRWMRHLDDTLVAAQVRGVDARGLLAVCGSCGAVATLVVFSLSASLPIAVCFAGMTAWAPMAFVSARARGRAAAVSSQWPDAVDHLASAVRAGLSLPEALGALAERGPEGLRPAFAAFADDYRVSGRFPASLSALKDRLADPVADRVVEALRITREVGGSDLGQTLRTLSAFLRDDARVRAELQARQSWTVNGARLAVAAPWIILALLATRPDAVAAYDTAAGAMVLVCGGVASVLAYRLMINLGRLPQDRRVLR